MDRLPIEGYVRLPQIIGNRKANPPIPPIIPVSKSTWWEGVRSGRYPKGVKLGPGITAWHVDAIRKLIAQTETYSSALEFHARVQRIRKVPAQKAGPPGACSNTHGQYKQDREHMIINLKNTTIIVPNGQWCTVEYDWDDDNEEGQREYITLRPIIAFALLNTVEPSDTYFDTNVVPITISGVFDGGPPENFTAYLRPDGKVTLACTATQFGNETFADLDEYKKFCRRAKRA
jgi:hypothetical protein